MSQPAGVSMSPQVPERPPGGSCRDFSHRVGCLHFLLRDPRPPGGLFSFLLQPGAARHLQESCPKGRFLQEGPTLQFPSSQLPRNPATPKGVFQAKTP